ncbi:hypothetical protein EN836_21940 [Mesorhizobium sp. M1C.F.Ca.ET.193.01.1.1]|uniref:hypothetical protein n=1 Tax=unclassified Mesorhizobium TaxID=325217 RepID=UPI000FD51FD8|nr:MULTISPECIES: hypothetical protein [unclassified Mesorhizobium]TGS95771.1 hypothetical protein EN820_42660 [bacterium M00.F.Ca.ET.177.01.1.1]TGQ51839.1 hypothetical protein EN853_21930 [Mesorhizobium sp. M1C.F.Ca.ET.210.01.1.1]TGQ68083.1 hypothetical protein EN855_021940 [Mesorhizobium sp. M1C.F.Ca.ET.212.01.1.1]TGR03362.1 hypothetical protein EN847_21930 [Mesorhizobium sp. M1C.F.Ca.ET.204.01.1.1]TGR23979.1 hypothetical protein EN839_21930 [Mesorhizobium sp. M1C.F.Ca.ET.196.01.1.1]
MLPATNDAKPAADRLATLDALRRRVANQSSADAREGVEARRILFSLGMPTANLRAALDALDNFERAIVEHDDRLILEARRLRCLAVLDGIIGGINRRAVRTTSPRKGLGGLPSGIA